MKPKVTQTKIQKPLLTGSPSDKGEMGMCERVWKSECRKTGCLTDILPPSPPPHPRSHNGRTSCGQGHGTKDLVLWSWARSTCRPPPCHGTALPLTWRPAVTRHPSGTTLLDDHTVLGNLTRHLLCAYICVSSFNIYTVSVFTVVYRESNWCETGLPIALIFCQHVHDTR